MPRRVQYEGSIHEFPDDATDDEIRQALSGQAKAPEGKSATGFLKNTVSSAGRFVGDIADAVIHPGQTVEGVSGLLAGMAEKSGFKPIAGVPHAQNVDALVNLYKERYGGWDKFLNSLYTDPVGVAADFATLASGVGAGAKGVELAADAAKAGRVARAAGTVAKAADTVSLVTDPLRATKKLADVTGVSGLVTRGAEATSEALTKGALRGGFNVNTDAGDVAAAVETMNKGNIPFSQKGIQDITQAIQDIQTQKFAVTGHSPARIDPKAVELRLDEVANRRDWQVNPNADARQIEQLRKNFRQRTGGAAITDAKGKVIGYKQGKPIPADEAEALKEGTYASNKYGSEAPPHLQATAEGEKALARGLKEELERQLPELTGLNEQQSKFINLNGILETAVNKHTNSGGFFGNAVRQSIGTHTGALKSGALIGTGIAAHEPGVGVALALAHAVLSDPAVKQRLAIAINKAQQMNPGKYKVPSMATALSRVDEYVASLQQ